MTGILTSVVLAFATLLRPFEWASLFLPIVPDCLLDCLQAPVPYILGVQSPPDEYLSDDVIVLDISRQNSKVTLQQSLQSQYHTFKLPKCEYLYQQIKPCIQSITNQSQRGIFYPDEAQLQAIDDAALLIRTHLAFLVNFDLLRLLVEAKEEEYGCRVSVETIVDKYLSSDRLDIPDQEVPFITAFLKTQIASQHLDRMYNEDVEQITLVV